MGRKRKKANTRKPHETLCWRCKNAVPNPSIGVGCAWSMHFKPVPNWDAMQTQVNTTDYIKDSDRRRATASYIVITCPKFERG